MKYRVKTSIDLHSLKGHYLNFFKMGNINRTVEVKLLPTSGKSRLWLNSSKDNELTLGKEEGNYNTAQHLYVISEEMIIKGDWFINLDTNKIVKAEKVETFFVYSGVDNCNLVVNCKRIIATTNLKIIEDRKDIYKLPNKFLKEYVERKNAEQLTKIIVSYTENYELSFRNLINVSKKGKLHIKFSQVFWNKDKVEKLMFRSGRKALNRNFFNVEEIEFRNWIRKQLENS